jgi:hypothetical protein
MSVIAYSLRPLMISEEMWPLNLFTFVITITIIFTLSCRLRRKRDIRSQSHRHSISLSHTGTANSDSTSDGVISPYAGEGEAGIAAEEEEEMALDDIARLEQVTTLELYNRALLLRYLLCYESAWYIHCCWMQCDS